MPVPLYQARAEFVRMLGHPVRIRVLELRWTPGWAWSPERQGPI
jgi:hypothetical protein